MDEQNLILVVVDDAGKFGAAPNHVARGELAFEYGVLQMIAVPAHRLEDSAQPLVISDVVTNQIGLPHLNHFSGKMFRIKGRFVPYHRAAARQAAPTRRRFQTSLQLGPLGARELGLRSASAFSHGLTASIVFQSASARYCPSSHATDNR